MAVESNARIKAIDNRHSCKVHIYVHDATLVV